MAEENLAVYLNDHLAGSAAAVELLARLERSQAATNLGNFFSEIRREVEDDRAELETLMDKLQVAKSRPRKAAAWLAEKFTGLKLRLDDAGSGPLGLLEGIEGVGLGIHGKLALWGSLAAAADAEPRLQVADFDRLSRRAEEQRRKLEAVRLQVAKQVLAPGRKK